MVNRSALLRSSGYQGWLSARGSNIEHELNPEPPDGIDDRVDLGVVLPGLELHDARLGDAELLCQRSLTQLVLGAITQKGRRKLPGWGEPLPLRLKAGIGELLLRHKRIEHPLSVPAAKDERLS